MSHRIQNSLARVARRSAAATLVVCAAIAGACFAAPQTAPTTQPPPATSPATQPGTGQRPPATQPAAWPTPTAGSVEHQEPVITVVEPGAEPRATLRRITAKGDASACEIITHLKIVMHMGQGATGEQILPDSRRVLQMRVTDVSDAGDAAFDLEFTRSEVMATPDVPESSVESVRGDVASIAGSRGTGSMSSRGFVRRTPVVLPAAANPGVAPQIDQVLKAVDQLAVVFPSEPVGAGARWRIEAKRFSEGIHSRIAHEVTLRRIEGSKIHVDIAISETAEPQTLANRPMPPGSTLHLDSLKVTGRGSAVIDLTRLALVSGTSTVNSEATLTGTDPDSHKQTIVQKMQIGTSVTQPTAETPAGQPARPASQPAAH